MTGTTSSDTRVLTQARRNRRSDRRQQRRRYSPGYAYIAAALVYLAIFILYPMGRSVWLSLTNENLLYPGRYVGLENYRKLFSRGDITHSLITTLVYVACVSVVALGLGLAGALFVDRLKSKSARATVRTLLTLPWVVPTLVIGLLFSIILSLNTGVVNSLLSNVGIGPIGWLTGDRIALISVTLVTAWNLFPFAMLVNLAALQSVPSELYEAAMLDGANYRNIVRRIILPYIRPTVKVVALFLVIWAFQQFQIIWFLTQGGPINGTDVLIIKLYKTGFIGDDLGTASAIGVVGLILSIIVTSIFFAIASPMRRSEVSGS